MNLRPWATPLVIASSLVVIITGVLLFFHTGGTLSKPAHEWIGWIMVIAVVAHIVVNFRAFKMHFSKPIGLTIAIVGVIITIATFFNFGSGEKGGRHEEGRGGSGAIVRMVTNAPVATIADLSGKSVDDINAILIEQGFDPETGVTLSEITGGDRHETEHALEAILAK